LYSPGPVACFSDEDDVSGNQNNLTAVRRQRNLGLGQFVLDESLEIEMSQAGPPREIMQDCFWGPGTD
jgi:hypothetical protein